MDNGDGDSSSGGGNAFGDWLRMERKRRGMSQARLGELAGASQSHISHLERGDEFPSCELAILLSRSLGLPDVLGAIQAGYISDTTPEDAEMLALLASLTGERRRLARVLLATLAEDEQRTKGGL